MSKTFEQWLALYNKKIPEGFKRDERFALFYLAEKGFAEIGDSGKMIIVNQVCGELKFWRGVAEIFARLWERTHIGTICTRPILPYLRLAGVKINRTEQTKFGKKYFFEDKYTGQKGQGRKAVIIALLGRLRQMEFKFDLQRFKGKDFDVDMPSEYEGELLQNLANSSLQMNRLGRNMANIANPQLADIQQYFGDMNSLAQAQEQKSLNQLSDDLTSSNWDLATITDDRLMSLFPQLFGRTRRNCKSTRLQFGIEQSKHKQLG